MVQAVLPRGAAEAGQRQGAVSSDPVLHSGGGAERNIFEGRRGGAENAASDRTGPAHRPGPRRAAAGGGDTHSAPGAAETQCASGAGEDLRRAGAAEAGSRAVPAALGVVRNR